MKIRKRGQPALDRDFSSFERTDTHGPDELPGHHPRNKSEVELMSHPDWPYIEFTRHLRESGHARKRVMDGVARHENRSKKPANSNDVVVALLREHRPLDFKGRFTLARAGETREWLARRRIYKSLDAITKMRNRAKNKQKTRK